MNQLRQGIIYMISYRITKCLTCLKFLALKLHAQIRKKMCVK